jgi:translocation and assembly module TamA
LLKILGRHPESGFERRRGRPAGAWLFSCGLMLFVLFLLEGLSGPEVLAAESVLSYRVSIEGLTDRELQGLLEGVSEAIALRERPPVSVRLLQRRVNRDIPLFRKVLRSQGFYGARVISDMDAGGKPVQVTFRIDTGPLYRIKSVDIQLSGEEPQGRVGVPERKDLGLAPGDPARSKAVVDVEERVIRWFRNRGLPFARMAAPRVVVDHGDRTVAVTYSVDPGPSARFGQTIVKGLQTVDEEYILRKIPWKPGDPFKGNLLQKGHRVLTGLGLFATVGIEEGKALDEKGALPVTIAVRERKHRSVGAGVSYRTDEGPGGQVSWEHRNILHRGERLSLSAAGSGIAVSMGGDFRKRDFLREDQSLLLSLRLADERPDAYSSRSLKSSVLVDRALSERLIAGMGLGFKESRVDQLGVEESYSLLSFPLHMDWDTSDDLLDPTRGGRLAFQFVPFYDASGTDHDFVKGKVGYRRYFGISRKPFLLLAGRINVGAIGGAERDDLPADERFYAGGGGSIRGYAYQTVGPLSAGQPVGGRALLELSLEMRLKVTDRFGLVGFLDGGGAFRDMTPGSNEDLLWGTGLGLRYFTPIGPLRLDVGIPLDRRDGVDDSFQIYASLGQAF